MLYSIILLIEKENENFSNYVDLIFKIFKNLGKRFEILIVANGVADFAISRLGSSTSPIIGIRSIRFHQKVSQAVCLKSALDESRGQIVIISGSTQELTADSYKRLITAMEDGIDVVVGNRRERKDPFFNRIHSSVLNKVLQKASGHKLSDIGCQIKLFKREAIEELDVYGNMVGYLTLLAAQKGFNIKEIECEQFTLTSSERRTSFYNVKAYINRIIDILNLFFNSRFSKKPLRFFSLLGSASVAFGIGILMYVVCRKIIYSIPIGSQSWLIVGLICLVAGAQIASFGLLAEMIAFIYGRNRKEYSIEKVV